MRQIEVGGERQGEVSSVRRIYVPEWRQLSALEQEILEVLIKSKHALTWYAVYMGIASIEIFVYSSLHGRKLSSMEVLKEQERLGGFRNLLTHYREKGCVFPAFDTVKDALNEFVKVGWVNVRTFKDSELYSISSEVAADLKKQIEV